MFNVAAEAGYSVCYGVMWPMFYVLGRCYDWLRQSEKTFPAEVEVRL